MPEVPLFETEVVYKASIKAALQKCRRDIAVGVQALADAHGVSIS